MKTLNFAQVRDCLILVASSTGPSPQDWAAYLDFMTRYTRNNPMPRAILFTQGWIPDPQQRQTLEQLNGAAVYDRAKIAVITSSTYARGGASAMQRMHPAYRIFSPESIDEALAYVDLPRGEFETVKRQISGMAVEIGGKPLM